MGISCDGSSALSARPADDQHAGSCLTCLDSDSDGDQDLIMGDISCNFLQFARNGGTSAQAYFNDTTALYPNYPAKSNTTTG